MEQIFKVISQLLPLILPTAKDIDPAEIIWAYTIVQTRAMLTDEENERGFGTGHLVPVVDLLRYARKDRAPACDFAPSPNIIGQSLRALIAVKANQPQLNVMTGSDGVSLLMRHGRPIGRLDDCVILTAPRSGLRVGEEARFQYHDPLPVTLQERMMFAMIYGFDPAA